MSQPLHPALVSGRGAVVTGAASGIGLAAAKRFCALGMNVVLADLPGPALEAAAKSAAQSGGQAFPVPTDVSELSSVQALKQEAFDKLGDVAVLMNNAGAARGGGALANYDGWRRVLGVNLWGVINGVQSFTPDMIASGRPGAIINTGSKQGITTPPGDLAYNVSKAGVKTVTEGLAHELRSLPGSHITAHLLVPGFVWTGMTSASRSETAEKPAAAWTAEQTIAFMIDALGSNQFYILCPDNETTSAMDRKRIAWTAGDLIENRPPLSRWHPDYKSAFDAFMASE